jgi:hypothetical protein
MNGVHEQTHPNDLAAAVYPSSPRIEPPPAAPPEGASLAERLYPPKVDDDSDIDTPSHVLELRKGDDIARRAYGATLYRDIPIEQAFGDAEPEVRQAAARQLRHIASDMGMSTQQARQVVDSAIRQRSSGEDSPDEALRKVNERYGPRAHEMLELGKKLVERDPRTGRLITQLGLGNDPDLVLMTIELAQQERSAGRLK